MKNLIWAELVKQYPGLSKTFLGTLAEKMAVKVTEESQIEGAITELNEGIFSIADLAAEADRRATDAVNTYKANNPVKEKAKPVTVETPATESPLEKLVKEMQIKLTAMESKEKQQTTRQTLLTGLKAKGIPEAMAKNITLADDANIDEIVSGIEADYMEIKQGLVTTDLKTNSFVPGSGSATASSKASILADIDKWVGKDAAPTK